MARLYCLSASCAEKSGGITQYAFSAVALAFSLLWLSCANAQVPDYEREARLADEAEAGLFDGDSVYLQAGDRQFLAILTESQEPEAKGAAVVMHGRGFSPDWPEVANPVRVGLAESGWTTLSIQMPVLQKDATYYEYLPILPASFPRIEAAIAYLRAQGYEKIALVAHSCSVHMTMAWLDEHGDSAIDAYVGIGMGATDYGQPMADPFPLERLTVPVLDVFGSQDYPAVIAKAPERNAAIEAGHLKSMQVEIDGPDHFFADYEKELVAAISGWLDELQ